MRRVESATILSTMKIESQTSCAQCAELPLSVSRRLSPSSSFVPVGVLRVQSPKVRTREHAVGFSPAGFEPMFVAVRRIAEREPSQVAPLPTSPPHRGGSEHTERTGWAAGGGSIQTDVFYIGGRAETNTCLPLRPSVPINESIRNIYVECCAPEI